MKRLKGITWNHTRGLLPMVATSQRFTELNPEIEISWEKRSLQEFADASIEDLAKRFDLLVIDHPWTGFGAQTNAILPLSDHLSPDYIKDQEINTVGRSYGSYVFGGKLWALPIDAATPVAAARLDILEKKALKVPQTYEDLLALAKKGLVGFAGIPVDILMSFYMYCCSLGEAPFQSEEKVISLETGKKALQLFRELTQLIDPANFNRNPIQIYEAMVNSDQIAYCPFAYGYSNYSRTGYSKNLLHFYDLVRLNNQPMISSLGGTGLAVSSFSQHIPEAIKYAEFTASSQVQQNIFADNGGQPGHLQAWKSDRINQLTHDYFKNTLPTLERAFLRPRYSGHMYFQDHAGDVVRDYLMNGGNENLVLEEMNTLYTKSLNLKTA
ncbi:ABC transporter substrate-binding protein [Flavobacterium yafengii]|jgi:multiple sugar transport system substrate-binding protein|uniref:ABC transporter substrate-binding protein n=1 Tax=Flavobacterium yafengii TaxID=3041253 RepID=A0AAW6TQ22_9FLAO|nr:ABC transporter substrate-binding protein [Flavobacterium yafengii]MDI5949935.1 ABC transporter substrate-binding protein [Flavobacterium yafengii]